MSVNNRSRRFITNGISTNTDRAGEPQKAFLDTFDAPLLLMQPEPRRVRTANRSACCLFRKELSQVEGLRGGEVFDCEHAFTERGCGLDEHARTA